MNSAIFYFFMLLMYNNEDVYQKATIQATLLLSLPHEEIDTFTSCNGKIMSIILKDSVLNAPGQIGAEYDYPIYAYETEIILYKDKNLAAMEKKQIHLKRYEYQGVTTGIEINATLDSSNTCYFDQMQNRIIHTQLLEIQTKICKEKDE